MYIDLFFEFESYFALVNVITSQKRLITSFKLKNGQKLSNFWKIGNSGNLLNSKTFPYPNHSKFSGDVFEQIKLKLKKQKSFFFVFPCKLGLKVHGSLINFCLLFV